jgi:phthiocerol/phenolphthiocerol synthesis type-I polyketide synthase E
VTAPSASRELAPLAGAAGSLAGAFREVAMRYPDLIAVHDDAAALSYRQIASLAGGIGQALSASSLGAGERVGLLLDHGSGMVAAAVGTMAAGGCYVPLDPGYPAERLAYMISRAGARLLLTSRQHGELGRCLTAGQVLMPIEEVQPADLVVTDIDQDQPAYLLYTSGSTGLPKGVAQTHRNVLHGAANHIAGFGIGPADKLSLVSSFSFDMAVTDMYAALLSGATVVAVDVRRRGIGHLTGALADRGVTIYHSTPTAFEYLVAALGNERLPEIRVVLLGGEHVTRAHVLAARAHFGDGCVFVNGYGATEASFAVQYRIGPADRVDRDVVPIGYPLPGYEILLLDGSGRQRRRSGEIAIRSRYLAPGYDRDQARTAERFSTSADGTLTYRTGDYGSLLADGRLACLGRTDRQVKIRGHRVELGEVEAHLATLPGVAHAAAASRQHSGSACAEIIGYVVPAAGSQPDPVSLRRALAERLPDYLLPTVIVIMNEFPLTPSGKVDVAALPAPPLAAASGGAPATATERLVAAAWCEVLGLQSVGVDVAFFDMGGHSLTMARLQRRLESALGRQIPLVALAAHASVRAFARYLDGTQADPLDRVNARMAKRRAMRGESQ